MEIDGYYVFNLELDVEGFALRANERVLLMFDDYNDWIGFMVSNGRGGFNGFSLDVNWVGYTIPNNRDGFNTFDIDGEWKGLFT